ncbi:MAG: FAD-dependent oxidoreductase [Actinomycetota bacterium]
MMQRRDFIKLCGILGIAAPLAGCGLLDDDEEAVGSSSDVGSVIVIGAGAAGLSAAHLLDQRGIDFRVLEAAPTYGGRIKTAKDFVDFPIPLGGEWIHVDADILSTIVNDGTIDVDTEVVGYRDSEPLAYVSDGEVELTEDVGAEDLKFVDATWLTFFEDFVLPGVESRIEYGIQILEIDYSGDGVILTDGAGGTHEADQVIVTIPPKQIQDRVIDFVPPLPDDQREAFDEARIWGGLKVFIEFSEKFYPTYVAIEGTDSDAGQKLYYDAAYGQRSDRHVLGLFTVGDQSEQYRVGSADALRDVILAELDAISDGEASRTYLQHISQDWNAEPFINQAYFADSGDWRLPARMREPLNGLVYFAGASYTDGSDWGSVHTAALSARDAVSRVAN